MITAGRLAFSVRDASRVSRENLVEAGVVSGLGISMARASADY